MRGRDRYGSGGLLLTPDSGQALDSGLSMALAAGTRGELDAGGADGFELAFEADALWMGTATDGANGPAGVSGGDRGGGGLVPDRSGGFARSTTGSSGLRGPRSEKNGMDDALPSVGMTRRFLALCEQYGSQEAAVQLVAQARELGVPGLPERNDWTAWNAGEMTAALKYLQSQR